MITLEVRHTGPLALVEDLGRPGLAHIGVTRSDAADRRAHRLANRLLVNPEDRATIEVTLGGFSARVLGGGLDITVTGADARPAIDGIPFGINSVAHIREGQVVSLGVPRSGEPTGNFPEVEQAPVAAIPEGLVALRVMRGPRDDWCADPDALVRSTWLVSERSDRVGVRLSGAALEHRWPRRQLPSEGAIRGAIQVPPNGQPVILGTDHPVTGGYPVIGVVIDDDVDTLAQLRPGQPVRLRWS